MLIQSLFAALCVMHAASAFATSAHTLQRELDILQNEPENAVEIRIFQRHKNEGTYHLPENINRFKKLESLHIASSNLGASLPSALGGLSRLHTLILSFNEIQGTLPPSTTDLTRLQVLDLSHNYLRGSLLGNFGQLSHLETLILSHNQFTGSIPSSFKRMVHLRCLLLNNNQLSGPIPSAISNLKHLEEIDLSHNQITGSIPSSFARLTSLEKVYLHHNQLEGDLPDLRPLSKLLSLELHNNPQLQGALLLDGLQCGFVNTTHTRIQRFVLERGSVGGLLCYAAPLSSLYVPGVFRAYTGPNPHDSSAYIDAAAIRNVEDLAATYVGEGRLVWSSSSSSPVSPYLAALGVIHGTHTVFHDGQLTSAEHLSKGHNETALKSAFEEAAFLRKHAMENQLGDVPTHTNALGTLCGEQRLSKAYVLWQSLLDGAKKERA